MKKKIAFIINPISGGINKEKFPSLIGRYLDRNQFEVEINFTRSAEHNLELAQQAVEQKKDVVIAVGGDGTINNVAKFMVNTGIMFGIVPQGSGNGLARHLRIPLNNMKALQIINKLHRKNIDAGMANDHFFVNVAGAGFDAHVSWMFANAPKRGFWSYTKITLNEFASYKPQSYELIVDGETVTRDAFIICVANGSQYGNNAFIAPQANLDDGLFDISVMKPFKMHQMPAIGLEMFMKKYNNSRYVDALKGENIIIKREHKGVFNIDGEPVMMDKDIHIRMLPEALKVIVP
ncbi:MAG: diacylglycerol kinase family protein [Bacteroidota bacterium]